MASTARRSAAATAWRSCREGDLVLERQVDHAVGVGRRLGQAVRVIDVALLDDGAGRLQPSSRFLGAGQADHLVAGTEQLGHDGRAESSPMHR